MHMRVRVYMVVVGEVCVVCVCGVRVCVVSCVGEVCARGRGVYQW